MFVETDVVVTKDEQQLTRWISEHVLDCRRSGMLESYSKSLVVPTAHQIEVFSDTASATAYAKYVMATAKLTQYVVDNLRKIIVDGLAGSEDRVIVKNSGLSLPLNLASIGESMAVINRATVLEHMGNVLEPHPSYESRWTIVDAYKPAFEGNLAEAYKRARSSVLNSEAFTHAAYQVGTTIRMLDGVGIETVAGLARTKQFMSKHIKLSHSAVREARNDLLLEQSRADSNAKSLAKAVSRDKFTTFWGDIKNQMARNVFPAEVTQSWDSLIPIPEKGTNTSRTWGIEVETVQAQRVSRPRGWEAKPDGSLESIDGEGCDCDCSDCYDGYHENCEDESSCMEYVSPILSHFHSDGLNQLCGPLEHAPKNSSPGIHVHVGADDLSIMDVGRLVRAYSLVSPFLEPISYRETRGYCKDVSSENLQYWLSAVRKTMRGELTDRYGNNQSLTPTDIVQAAYYQPDDRYRDLNLMSLTAHGTIEFRVMGPQYNYNHLVKWAWFCREMVNVARLDLPSSVWSSVRSMADVIGVLRQYGSELPSESPDKEIVALANVLNDTELVEA
jgi:hypothetical protein